MFCSISRRWWLGLIALAWFGFAESGHAWDNPMVRVSRVHVNFHVEMSTTPTLPPPIAPWYAYFPANAQMMPAMQTSPYPPWPMPYPPPVRPMVAPKQIGSPSVAPGPMVTQYGPSYSYGPTIQPVGFVPAQAPSYWYQGR